MYRNASAFITHNNKLLVLHRDNIPTITDPDKWSVIGGGVEDGETPEEGMRREIKEESNLNPRNLKYLGRLGFGDHEVYCYTAKLDDDEATQVKLGNEGSEIKFVSYDEVKTLPLTKNLQYYLEKYPDSARKLLEGGEVTATELGLN